MLGWIQTLLLLVPLSAAEGESITMTLLTNPWPTRPRVIGYEYNQKNHHDTPSFVKRPSSSSRAIDIPGKRYRVVGIRLVNDGDEEAKLKIRSPQIRRNKKISVQVPPQKSVTRYFAIREPKEKKLEVLLTTDKGLELDSQSIELIQKEHTTRSPSEAVAVAKELEHEDSERRRLATRLVSITLRDDLELAVPDAHLVLLQENGLMVYEGATDATGSWRGRVMPGSYHVLALAEVPDRTDREAQTSVEQLPRLLVVEGKLAADGHQLELAPQRAILTTVQDVDGRTLEPSRIWITPGPLAEAYRFQMVASSIGGRARVDSSRPGGGRFWLLTSHELSLHVALLAEPDDGLSILLRTVVPVDAKSAELTFDPSRLARAVIDPACGYGPGKSAQLQLVAVGNGLREEISVDTAHLHTFYLTPGEYRAELSYRLLGQGNARFLPFVVNAAPGQFLDLTPRAPFQVTAFYKRIEKKMQLWLAVRDKYGRLLASAPGSGGKVIGRNRSGKVLLRDVPAQLRWELASGAEQVDMKKLVTEVLLPFGEEQIHTAVDSQPCTAFNVEGASGYAPSALGANMEALLPEVKKSVDGCLKYLGLPEGAQHIHMEFDLFLPPGIGGTGGGGRINLDIPALYPFATGTDPLPGAFRHELGHNLGFGHDPYMLLADVGVDEERFSTFGYRMLHAGDFQRTLRYLESERSTEKDPWAPGPGVFAGMRLLFGEDVHRRMIQQRKVSEQTLRLHDLSSIERIATLYSLTLNRNVAWVFRAHGWPVFDERVDLGGTAALFVKKHPRQLNYQRVNGTPVTGWWVFGPLRGNKDEPKWRRAVWPYNFIAVDEDRPAFQFRQRYLFFRRLVVPRDVDAEILCASDVQLEIRLNGNAIGYLDASPQYSQPRHDELMLNQKRSFRVNLYKGENLLEVAVNQPHHSKGFLLEFITPEGKPLPLGFADDGPPGEKLSIKLQKLKGRNPIYNSSFELGEKFPTAWNRGANEGPIKISLGSSFSDGHSLRFDLQGPARGGVIQRVVVKPDKRYRLTAKVRTQQLAGEVYV
ncbi:MAG: hypothetical protein V3T77_02345, partial [Planctomycetota bacterium]